MPARITSRRRTGGHLSNKCFSIEGVALSNCVHRAQRGLSSYSGGLEHLALGRYAIQQILPGLGERFDTFP